MVNYTKAKKYAVKCGYGTDLVHDAYVKWYKKTGKNLFLEKEYIVISVMKWTVRAFRAATRYRGGGQNRQREYITALEDNVLTENGDIITQGFVPKMEPNQVDYCYLNQMDNGIAEKLHSPAHPLSSHDKTLTVYEYVKKGYILGEISKELNLPKSTIAHHIEKIRKIGQSIGYIKNVQTGR